MKPIIIVGAGFYGAMLADYWSSIRRAPVILLEREPAIMRRASYHNQARIHNGYHYPRAMTTAYRSRVNMPRFMAEWPDAVHKDFTKIYAIAREHSKINATQFMRFCKKIGAPIAPATENITQHLDHSTIEDAYIVEEYAFDATILAQIVMEKLSNNVDIRLETEMIKAYPSKNTIHVLVSNKKTGQQDVIQGSQLFNCSYSAINTLTTDKPLALKHEITEMVLADIPSHLRHLGITVMDGPFFSVMPFPSRALHSISHVKYTPHRYFFDQPADACPYQKLNQHSKKSNFDRMIRDISRFMPDMAQAAYRESLFEIKTILFKSETNDGRPIVFRRHPIYPWYDILGGKIDNIFDILEKLNADLA
jgi:hypothetical protein